MNTPSNALVLGMGRSGLGAARLLLREGARVTVADAGPLPAGTSALAEAGVLLRPGLREPPPEPFDLAVVSPGFAVDHPWLDELRRRGVPPS